MSYTCKAFHRFHSFNFALNFASLVDKYDSKLFPSVHISPLFNTQFSPTDTIITQDAYHTPYQLHTINSNRLLAIRHYLSNIMSHNPIVMGSLFTNSVARDLCDTMRGVNAPVLDVVYNGYKFNIVFSTGKNNDYYSF